MLLNDLVLTSLENLNVFVVNGKPLTEKTYEALYHSEVEKYYLDIDKNKMIPIMVIELTEN